jgi:hypothetical protein
MGTAAYAGEVVLSHVLAISVSIAKKVAIFTKSNWRQLIAYILAWGVVVTCTGLMYGFQAVALPLTIGLACGLAFGVITAILILKAHDPTGNSTFWNWLNHGIENLDANGTRQIVLAVAVTVLLAASVVFPYVLGAVIGIFIGNQLASKVGAGLNLGRPQTKSEKELLRESIISLEKRIGVLTVRMDQFQGYSQEESIGNELKTMEAELNQLKKRFLEIYSPGINHDHSSENRATKV